MALLDWILVAFGAAVAVAGSWIQLHPERVVPGRTGPRKSGLELDPAALAQIRLLGACFLCMGAFFALQMTMTSCGFLGGPDLSGLVAAIRRRHQEFMLRVAASARSRRIRYSNPPALRKASRTAIARSTSRLHTLLPCFTLYELCTALNRGSDARSLRFPCIYGTDSGVGFSGESAV